MLIATGVSLFQWKEDGDIYIYIHTHIHTYISHQYTHKDAYIHISEMKTP